MTRLELSLKILTLSFLLAACSRTPPPVLPPQPPAVSSPSPTPFSGVINPPVDVGEPTSNRVAGDITFELTFPEGTDIEGLPEVVTVAGAEFQRQLPAARQGVVIVLYVAVDPNQPLDTTQLVVFSLPGVLIEFSVVVRFRTPPSPTPSVLPTATPSAVPSAEPSVMPSSPTIEPSPAPVPPSDPGPPAPPTPSIVVNTLDDEDGTNPNKCSLREAIIANNTSADFGGCAIHPSGTITFDAALTGGTITIGSIMPPITRSIMIDGPGASNLTISGNKQFNIFNVDSAGSSAVTIKEITLTQGAFVGQGGAIRHTSAGVLTIQNAVISESTTQVDGGAIRSTNGDVHIINSTLSDNSAGNTGGAISAVATVTVTNSIFRNNAAASDTSGSGGAIEADDVQVTGGTFEYNSAFFGGGISATTVTIENSTLSQNTAVGGNGGGIGSGGTVTLNQSTLKGNDAESRGGGIYASTANIDNSTLSGNNAGTNGGGIYALTRAEVSNSTLNDNTADNDGGGIRAITAEVSNSTLSGNSANFGGGIRTPNQAGSGLTLTNSILSNNQAGSDGGGVNIDGVLSINQSQLDDNTADGQAGGIRAITATVTNSTLSGNSAGSDGGGIFVQTTATVSNSTLSGNDAEDRGGGIYAETSATVRNSTFYDNRSTGRGNSINFESGTFVNNLVISDSYLGTSEVAAGYTSDPVTIRYNVIRARSNLGISTQDTAGTLTVTNNRIYTNNSPIFQADGVTGPFTVTPNPGSPLGVVSDFLDANLAANSTTVFAGDPNAGQQPVLTHALVTGSPAIDEGNDSLALDVDDNPLSVDQRGLSRPVNTAVDIGAFEVQ